MDNYSGKGWASFPFDPNLYDWAIKVHTLVTKKINSTEGQRKKLRCGDTWFPGVNFLENDSFGNIDGALFPEKLLKFIKHHEPNFGGIFDKGQISICYTGYPRRMNSESKSSFDFRRNRYAAHIDGILPVGKTRRRFIKEYHSFILGIPINQAGKEASPCVIWEGSHEIIKNELRKYKRLRKISNWGNEDITEFYNDLRKKIFSSCEVKEIWVPMGHAYIINRLSLHGIMPWNQKPKGDENSRMIAYFRPDLKNGQKRWLE